MLGYEKNLLFDMLEKVKLVFVLWKKVGIDVDIYIVV